MRCLFDEDYFYMIVFSYFGKDPSARRIVGLKANSVTTNEYQSAFREGGGMAIAALARISQWDKNGEFTSKQYLDGAKRAYMHLLQNNMDGYPMWQWFSDFMGGIRFVDYIPTFAKAQVNIEDKSHAVIKGIPISFFIEKEEWYIYDKSPRQNVHVLASVDETTYSQFQKLKWAIIRLYGQMNILLPEMYIFSWDILQICSKMKLIRLF